jgi:predicted Fe-Mo cluster-binding NifX family protein
MKLAIVTDDGDYVSQHFGRARYFKIYTIEDGKITGSELRERTAGHFGGHHHHHEEGHHHGEHDHGHSAGAMHRHDAIAQEIADCQAVIAGGMGMGAFESMRSKGLEVILTNYHGTEETATAFAEGKIENLADSRTH